jgi:hypothetical protein
MEHLSMELSRHITIYTKQFYLIEVVKHLLTTIFIKKNEHG